jgi:hypothetical protein
LFNFNFKENSRRWNMGVMDEGRTRVSCYGFWPMAKDGEVGSGPPKTVYCAVGDKVKGLILSSGNIIDLLDAANVVI